jgi:DNA mismatch endonuclease (patch repair protein)
MADFLSAEARSAHMRRIRKIDTLPELRVRRAAHALGFRFRLHRRDLPGTPDLVFPRLRIAIWVHGCFWHQHLGCRLARQPKSRLDYWLPKLKRNQDRDAEAITAMCERGWTVLVIWECEVPTQEDATNIVSRFLLSDDSVQSNTAREKTVFLSEDF